MENFIKQRSLEIVFAVFRVAGLVKHSEIRKKLENLSLDFLLSQSLNSLESLSTLIKLSEVLGEVKSIDAKVLYREISNVDSAMRQKEKESSASIESIFSAPPMVVKSKSGNGKHRFNLNGNVSGSGNEIGNKGGNESRSGNGSGNGNGNEGGNGNGNLIHSAMRQTAILEKIRQLPDCRMKDLIPVFPEVSERTLRNDLQRLYEQGLIERVGGGPSGYYRVKSNDSEFNSRNENLSNASVISSL